MDRRRATGGIPGVALSAVAGALLAIVSLAAVPVAAGATPPSWSPPAPTFGTGYVLRNVEVPMSDGVVLRANIGIPTPLNASTPAPGARFPVLLSQTPYRKDGGLFTVDPYFVGRGFVSMVIDVRGTGSSRGNWSSFSPREQQDGPEIVNWISRQSWYDPGKGVGFIGASYLAINQLLTLEQVGTFVDPGSHATVDMQRVVRDNVRAIFPVVPMSDSYRDVTFHGGNLDDAFMVPWLGLVTALGAPPASQLSNGNPSDTQDSINVFYDHVSGAAQFQVPSVAAAMTGGPFDYDGDFSQVRSPIRHIDRVKVPVFMVGGEFDIFQRGEPLLFKALDVPYKKLVLGPWIHLQGSTASTLPADGIPDLKTMELAWYSHYLQGVDTGITSGPQVFQYELKGTSASHFVGSQDYPIRPWAPTNLYLAEGSSGSAAHAQHDGVLSPSPPKVAGSDTLLYTPGTGCTRTTFQWGDASLAQVGINAFPCETDERVSEVAKLTYTTPPVSSPQTIDGPINVHLVAEAPTGGNITFTVNVADVAPDGTSTQLSAGWLLASMRAVEGNPATLTVDGKLMRVFHPFTKASEQGVPSGPVAYDIEVFPTFATFDPGHRIRLDVGTGDFPHSAQSVPNLVNSAPSLVLHRDPSNPSYVTLPTMAGGTLGVTSFVSPASPPRVAPPMAADASLPLTSGGHDGGVITGILMLAAAVFMSFLFLRTPRWPSRD
ncbi:MAG: CocE/NonD family hydrolase [Candidatus Dormibacteria bacterium]